MNINELKQQIDVEKLPLHIAIIMDGNGRWAKTQGQNRLYGHHNGVQAVRDTVEAAAEIGVKFLTLYAFSTENWNRPKAEVEGLMSLLVATIKEELPTLQKNKIRLQTIGNTPSLPEHTRQELQEAIEATQQNDRMTLVLALSYSAKWELVQATQHIAQQVKQGFLQPEDIDETVISNVLSTKNIPDPELLIRTSGETRISNFLLWQIAYTELYFTPIFWPDFRKEHLLQAILDYQQRERRFGMTSEQVQI
jgi:undecaprenyl diphosphate synthase